MGGEWLILGFAATRTWRLQWPVSAPIRPDAIRKASNSFHDTLVKRITPCPQTIWVSEALRVALHIAVCYSRVLPCSVTSGAADGMCTLTSAMRIKM